MSKLMSLIAVLMCVLAAQASASPGQDFRSPDARAGTALQDFRSPDAQRAFRAPAGAPADRRSPDARVSGQFQPTVPVSQPTSSSSSFDWGYLAVGIALALIGLGGVAVAQRRRHHGLAVGS